VKYLSTLVVAQSLGEYGGMGTALADAFSRLRIFIEQQLFDSGPRGWVIAAGALALLWFFFRGRR
jgi:hypothetical protein